MVVLTSQNVHWDQDSDLFVGLCGEKKKYKLFSYQLMNSSRNIHRPAWKQRRTVLNLGRVISP